MKKRILASLLTLVMLSGAFALPAKADASVQYTTKEETAKSVRALLAERQEKVTVNFELTGTGSDIEELALEIFDIATEHTRVAYEGDYIYMNILNMLAPIKWSASGDKVSGSVTYEMNYAADAAKEKEAAAATESALASLALDGKSEYEKAKAIYDFICDNIEYDFTYQEISHSSYAAIVLKKAVCQGYSSLFYRMALSAGLDCRVITGVSNNEEHGWNIVRIGGKWYNVDSTFGSRNEKSDFFLKGSGNFPDHARNDLYDSASFNAAHPMSATDYVPGETPADESVFSDIDPAAYYAEAVKWAYENGVTSGVTAPVPGVSPGVFGVGQSLTRAMAAVFLYSYAKASPVDSAPGFPDVEEGRWYTKQILWMSANGYTAGYDDGRFGTNDPVKRGESLAFLRRIAGGDGGTSTFADVAEGSWLYAPVAWAASNGVLDGVPNGTGSQNFLPYDNCTREDFVTFLYKMNKLR